MKYYILDTTIGKNPVFFSELNEVIKYLEGSCKRTTGLSRKDYMQNRVDLGHPYDESSGRNFIEAMAETINMGLVKNDGLMRCNICEATHYSKYTNEMGH
jgi:hypothetical protein|tara:strand:- start:103 stop:402 length:300 start_codon:yes stop_codon:yes gene_type:complete